MNELPWSVGSHRRAHDGTVVHCRRSRADRYDESQHRPLPVHRDRRLHSSSHAEVVRWVRGEEAGIETLVMNEESEARLNTYILERVKAL